MQVRFQWLGLLRIYDSAVGLVLVSSIGLALSVTPRVHVILQLLIAMHEKIKRIRSSCEFMWFYVLLLQGAFFFAPFSETSLSVSSCSIV